MIRTVPLLCAVLLVAWPGVVEAQQRHVLPSAGSAAGSGVSMWGAADCATITSPVAGSTWCFDTTAGKLRGYSGTAFYDAVSDVINVQEPPYNVLPSRTAAQNGAGLVAALATGRSVYIPSGSYSYDTTLTMGTIGQQLFGAGPQVTILTYTGTGNGINVGSTTANVRNVTIRDLRLIGSATAGHGITGGAITSSLATANLQLRNLWIRDWAQSGFAGIFVSNAVTTHIDNVFFELNYNGFQDSTVSISTTTTLVNAYFQSQINNGALLRRGKGTRFIACTIEGSGAEAIKADSLTTNVESLDILDCWFENNNTSAGTYTVVLTGAAGRTVTGGRIRGGHWEVNVGKKHIQLDRAEDTIVDIQVIGVDTPATTTANAGRVLVHGFESTVAGIPVLTPIASGLGLVYKQATAYGNVYSIMGKALVGHETAGTEGRVLLSGATIGGKGAGTVNTWGQNANDEILALSYHGHEDSANYFRDTAIYDGKEGRVAFFDGSTKGVTFDGAVTVTGATTLNGAVTLGNAAADNVTITGTITSNAIFTDNTYDIGASGATRPRHLYLSGDATIGDQLIVSGAGPHAIGGATVAARDLLVIGSTATSAAFGLSVRGSGGAELFAVRNDGNVGIGTAGPATSAYGNRVLDIKGTDASVILEGTTSTWEMGLSGTTWNLFLAGTGSQIRTTAVGTTLGSSLNPVNRLDVFGNAAIGSYAGVNAGPSNGLIVSGNVGIGTTTPGGSGTVGTAVLSLANGTPPVGGVGNQVSLYSADVAASAELFALDEAGNTPQLSPHPSNFLNTLTRTDGPYAYPWAYVSVNRYLGKQIQVDMAGIVAAVEQLTGQRFAVVTPLPVDQRLDWDTTQNQLAAARTAEIDRLTAERARLQAAGLEKEAQRLQVLPPYIRKAPPAWMRARGVSSNVP